MEHSNSKKRGEGFRALFRRGKGPGGSPSAAIPPSVGPDGQSHPLIEASHAIPAQTSVGEKPDTAEAIPNSQGIPEDNTAPVTNGDVRSQSQGSGHEDGVPIVGSSAALPPASTRDLWAEAWDQLDKESQERLRTTMSEADGKSSSIFEVARVDKVLNRRYESADRGRKGRSATDNSKHYVQRTIDATKKALKQYQRQSGPITQVADTGKKILTSALTVKQLLDAGAKFDPTGYGACAWAVLSFGLTLIENANNSKRLAFEAAATLSGLLADYSQTEIRYLKMIPSTGAKASTKGLEDALVEAYTAILKYSAAVRKTTHGSRRERVGDSFIALIGEPLIDLKETIREQDIIVMKWKEHVKHENDLQFQNIVLVNQEQIDAEVNRAFVLLEKIQDDLAVAKDDVEYLAGSELLDWLSPPKNSSNVKYEELRALEEGVRQPRFWFTQSHEYRQWKVSAQSLLCLYAPKGCGKSSLCSSIIADLSALDEDEAVNRQKLVVFWYFQSKDATKDLRTIVLRSILRQLCSSSSHAVPKEIKEWLTEASRSWSPSRKELLGKIRSVIAMLSLDIFIVLDGIDEIPASPAVKNGCTREQALELASELIRLNEKNPKLHILLSSNPEEDIRKVLLGNELKSVTNFMNVEGGLQKDLHYFIEKTMESDKGFKSLKPNVQGAVRERLSGGKEKSFLWVTLMLDELRQYDGDAEEIIKHLQDVPPSLADEYRKCLASVKDHYKEKVTLMLMWLLWHQRDGQPLTEQEMIVAARLKDSSPSDVAKQVMALVKMSTPIFGSAPDGDEDDEDRPSRHIEFVHFSAREYLKALLPKPTQKPSDRSEADIRWPPSFLEEEAHLQMATQCMEVLLDEDEYDRPKDSPLKKYAAQYWYTHYLSIRKTGTPGQKDAEKTRAEQKILEQEAAEQKAAKQKATKLAELNRLVETLLTPSSKEVAFESWLGFHDPDVKDSRSNLDMGGGRDYNDNSSESSSDFDSHSDKNSHDDRSEDGNSPAHPVYYAVKLGLLDIAIRLIKRHQVNPDERPGKEGTMLQLALYYGHWEVASTLLEYYNGQDKIVDDESGPYGTALYIASAKADGQTVRTVKDLINRGARVDRAGEGKYGSALHAAAYFGSYDAVQALVDKDKEIVDQEGGVFGTALNTAAARGHEDIVELLLSYNASPTTVSGLFGTALQASIVCDLHPASSVRDILQEAISKHVTTSASRIGFDWQSAFNRFYNCNPELFEQYMLLFPIPNAKPGSPHITWERELTPPQIALASVLELWHLPGAGVLHGFRDYLMSLPYRTPYGEPLQDILGALPDFENCADELNRRDFCYKALFWSGINYILENLDLLIDHAITSMRTAFSRACNFSRREYELLHELEDYPFMYPWMDHTRMRRDRQYWDRLAFRRSRRHVHLRRSRGGPWGRHFNYEYDVDKDMDMNLSDKLHLEMARKQQLLQMQLSQKRIRDGRTTLLAKTRGETPRTTLDSRSEITASSNYSDYNAGDNNNDNASGDGNDRDKDEDNVTVSNSVSVSHGSYSNDSGNDSDDGDITEIHLVVDNLLPLIKDLVEFGKQCDRLHERASIPAELSAQTIPNLTFEVLAAVARLAISIREWVDERKRNAATESTLAQTVQLVRSVRLPRITRLAAAARGQQLPNIQKGDIQGAENGVVIRTGSTTSSSVVSDSRPLLEDAETTTTILDELPGLVRDHVGSVMDRVRNQMCDHLEDIVRDAVRSEMERQQEVSDGVSLSPSEKRKSRGWAGYLRGVI